MGRVQKLKAIDGVSTLTADILKDPLILGIVLEE